MIIDDLNANRFREHPVWVLTHEIDDVTVSPLDATDGATGELLVRTQFIDASQHEYTGYVFWAPEADVSLLRPVLFAHGTHLCFWSGLPPTEQERENFLGIAFPVRYSTYAHPEVGVHSGELRGIYFLTDKDFQLSCVAPDTNLEVPIGGNGTD